MNSQSPGSQPDALTRLSYTHQNSGPQPDVQTLTPQTPLLFCFGCISFPDRINPSQSLHFRDSPLFGCHILAILERLRLSRCAMFARWFGLKCCHSLYCIFILPGSSPKDIDFPSVNTVASHSLNYPSRKGRGFLLQRLNLLKNTMLLSRG